MTTLFTVDFENNRLWDTAKGFDKVHVSGGTIATTSAHYEGSYGCAITVLPSYYASGIKFGGYLSRIRQAFYLHPNALAMANGNAVTIARNWVADTYAYWYRIRLKYATVGGYQLDSICYASNETSSFSGSYNLPSQTGWNLVEFDWREASSGTVLQLWIDGTLKYTHNDISTSGTKVVHPCLCSWSPSAGMSGSFLVDYWRANDTGDLIGA